MSRFDDRYLNYGDVYSIIMQAKTVDQSMNVLHLPYVEMPKWIPTSERLPEEDADVLCTIHFVGTHLAPLAREWLVDICHCRDGEWYTYLDDDATKDAWFDVVAWQPLPEPYGKEITNG